jgi:DNA-directed RNA polymerase specialized sigma24 family protein
MADLDQLNATGEGLHRELLGGDPVASGKIAELFMPALIAGLDRKFHNLSDPHLVGRAVADALLNYLGRPQKFDPARGKLFTYLWIAAQSDLLNHLEGERRHASLKVDEKLVELRAVRAVNETEGEHDPETELLLAEEASLIQMEINDIISDESDRKAVELMLDGVRETAPFAEILGVVDKSPEEQALLVKRTKDRIKIALRRGLKPRKSK